MRAALMHDADAMAHAAHAHDAEFPVPWKILARLRDGADARDLARLLVEERGTRSGPSLAYEGDPAHGVG